ncbi:MAG: hypothetical protein VB934_11090, partial [Polyangiaceae bacterium]
VPGPQNTRAAAIVTRVAASHREPADRRRRLVAPSPSALRGGPEARNLCVRLVDGSLARK